MAAKNNKSGSKRKMSGRRRPSRDGSKSEARRYKDFKSRSGSQGFFPPPTVLQEYEYAQEGAANRILDMLENEQRRRNQWEDRYTAFYQRTVRLGQILGFMILFTLIITTAYLASIGKDDVALILAAIGFFSFGIANIFSYASRKVSGRPKISSRARARARFKVSKKKAANE